MWDRVTVNTAPADVAVTVDEAKAWLNVTFTDDDALITSLIAAATAKLDGPRGIGVACFTQTWDLSLDAFPSGTIYLPGWPVKSVVSVAYVDTDGATQTINSANYTLDIKGDQARLSPAYGVSWPSTRRQDGAVTISYVVGEVQDDIHPLLKLAIRLMVSHWYEHREEGLEVALHQIPMGAEQIMRDFMRGSIAA